MGMDAKDVAERLRALESELSRATPGAGPDDARPTGKDGISRRAVVAAWRGPERDRFFANAEDAARWAGLGRRAFFNLLKRSADRAGGAGSTAAADAAAPSRAALVAAAESLISRNEGASPADIARMLGAGAGAGLSRSSLVRLVAEARRQGRGRGPAGFGGLIALDSASLDLVDAEGRRCRLYAALDVATRVLLAWHVEGEGAFDLAYAQMCHAFADGAPDAIGADDLRGLALADDRRLEISLPADADFFLAARLAPCWSIVSNQRRFGSRLVEALGTRLAGLRIAAGVAPPDVSHRSRTRTRLPIFGEGAARMIREALIDHDREALDALARTSKASDAAAHVRSVFETYAAASWAHGRPRA